MDILSFDVVIVSMPSNAWEYILHRVAIKQISSQRVNSPEGHTKNFHIVKFKFTGADEDVVKFKYTGAEENPGERRVKTASKI